MAYRYGDRRQAMLFPQSIEEYVPQEAPVRAYDAFVEALDLDELGIQIDPHKVGCPQYEPKVMLKLLIYGYSYGIRSSRKLERETHYNLSFMWLVGGSLAYPCGGEHPIRLPHRRPTHPVPFGQTDLSYLSELSDPSNVHPRIQSPQHPLIATLPPQS
ncbi:MAG: transposase [Sedimentisphaerales bacterium]|nr:transposase [Sedimentisphaerales bacterium]